MKPRHVLVLLLALAVGGCASMTDKIIARVGGPERGFLTPDFLTDAGATVPVAPDRPMAANGCTAAGCPQASNFCTARGYNPGTDSYARCVVSVEQNLHTASLRK
jgi:hypothetical protein